jgi:hypothetical protein
MIFRIFTSTFVLLCALSPCACQAKQRPISTVTESSASPKVLPSSSQIIDKEPNESVSLGGGLHIVAKSINAANDRLRYEIGIGYPEITGSKKPQVLRFNQAAASLANREARLYRRAQLAPREKLPPWWKDTKEYLSLTYDVIFADDRLISIRFDKQTYTRGAGHAVQQFRVVNYDLEKGRPLQLDSLFTPNSQYLKFITDYCLNSLREQNKKDCFEAAKDSRSGIDREYCEREGSRSFWLPEFERPTLGNFQFWSLRGDGLLVSFEECRMAPCAAGPREVLIPYPSLKSIAKQKGVLSQARTPPAN